MPPLAGVLQEGRLYGRGVSDMKGGIAASVLAASVLARHRESWDGEIVITLAGDEESMGALGTRWLLENVPEARGDAMICGDVGSPLVVRFGEKGLVWIEIEAEGSPAHGAHVHKGVNAIDRLRAALDALKTLEALTPNAPQSRHGRHRRREGCFRAAFGSRGGRDARAPHRQYRHDFRRRLAQSRAGPSQRRRRHSRARRDHAGGGDRGAASLPSIRSTALSWRIVAKLSAKCDRARTTRSSERRCEPPRSCSGEAPVVNMRVGASDARLYRMFGVPSVVFGCTPFNMGGPDEHILVDELVAVAQVHALAAFDFLTDGTQAATMTTTTDAGVCGRRSSSRPACGFMGAPFASYRSRREGGDPRRSVRLRHPCLPDRLAPGAGLDPRAIAAGARL